MKTLKFNKLAIGEIVTLATQRKCYGCSETELWVPAGASGKIGAVKVPSVTGRNGKSRYFVCVDFPKNTPLVDRNGNTPEYSDERNVKRVAAYADELT